MDYGTDEYFWNFIYGNWQFEKVAIMAYTVFTTERFNPIRAGIDDKPIEVCLFLDFFAPAYISILTI
jgi:hypothetical protein